MKSDNTLYHALLESATEGIILVDEAGIIEIVNKSSERLFGYQREELIGQGIEILIPDNLRKKHQALRNGYLEKPESRPMGIGRNLIGRKKDGSEFPIEVSLSPVSLEGRMLVMSFIIDISQRRKIQVQAEMQRQQLIQADKMATLGILVSGVAHEINNPNNFIMLNANIIADMWQDVQPILESHLAENGDFNVAGMPFTRAKERIGKLIQATGDGAERIRKIVDSLKNFARQDKGDFVGGISINKVIDSAITITQNLIKRSTHHFSLDVEENLPTVYGNTQQLEQVIINLITNACQALPNQQAKLFVRSGFDEAAGTISIKVADEGSGITKEDLGHVFDPFFTTKRTTGGTGLGLSISYNIVKDHEGTLQLTSESGVGTTATVILPIESARKTETLA